MERKISRRRKGTVGGGGLVGVGWGGCPRSRSPTTMKSWGTCRTLLEPSLPWGPTSSRPLSDAAGSPVENHSAFNLDEREMNGYRIAFLPLAKSSIFETSKSLVLANLEFAAGDWTASSGIPLAADLRLLQPHLEKFYEFNNVSPDFSRKKHLEVVFASEKMAKGISAAGVVLLDELVAGHLVQVLSSSNISFPNTNFFQDLPRRHTSEGGRRRSPWSGHRSGSFESKNFDR